MNLRYRRVIGTGGIGKGMLFYTEINEVLKKSESRMVSLSPAKDYCKQHIVLHYTSTLLAPGCGVIPIGYIGKDNEGASLLNLMKVAGMDTSMIGISSDLPTTLSICLQYPDKETCNFTVSNSAAELVTPTYINSCLGKLGVGKDCILAAVPEVPVEVRLEMLKKGKETGAFCVLSMTVSEAEAFWEMGVFKKCDLLSVNEEEAAAISHSSGTCRQIAAKTYQKLLEQNESIMLTVTCGKEGAYTWHMCQEEHIPCIPASPINTTGAGDAFLGGTIAGLALGFPFQKGRNDGNFGDTMIGTAPELGTICAGMAVESMDSIATSVTKDNITARIFNMNWQVERNFKDILKNF